MSFVHEWVGGWWVGCQPGERSVGAKLTPVTVKVEPTEFGMLVLPVGFVKAGASNENEIVDVPIAKLVATTA